MAAINEGFQHDEESKEATVCTKTLDYSKAQKRPQILAALAGTSLINWILHQKQAWLFTLFLYFTAVAGGFVLGNFLGFPSPVQPQLQDLDGTGDPSSLWYIALTTEEMSWVSSLMTLGALVGGMTGGIFMDMLGRRTTLILISVPAVLGWLLMVLTVNPSNLFFFLRMNLWLLFAITLILLLFSYALHWLFSGWFGWRDRLCGIS